MMSIKNILEFLILFVWFIRFYEIPSLFTKRLDHENSTKPTVLCRKLNALKPSTLPHGIKDAVFLEEKGLVFMTFGHTSKYSSKFSNITGIIVYEINGFTNPIYEPIILNIARINPIEVTAISHHGDIVRIAILSDTAELTIFDYSSSEKDFRGPLFRIHDRYLDNAKRIRFDEVESLQLETGQSRYEILNFIYRIFTFPTRKTQAIKFSRYRNYTISSDNSKVNFSKSLTIELPSGFMKLSYQSPPEYCQNQESRLSAVLQQFHALKGRQLKPFTPKPISTSFDNGFKSRSFILSLLNQCAV